MWAIAVGKAHIILVYDDFEMIGEAIGEVFVFWRKSDGKMVFVLLNMTSARITDRFVFWISIAAVFYSACIAQGCSTRVNGFKISR